MTAHELARKLLDLPDVEVMAFDDEYDLFRPVADPSVVMAAPRTMDAKNRVRRGPGAAGAPVVVIRPVDSDWP